MSRYDELVAAGELRPDAEQAAAARKLAALRRQLADRAETGFIGKLLGKKPAQPRGIYMWGGVGRGKSMLMDLFHDALAIEEKRRVHFHAFMQEVHQKMRSWREADPGDPIPNVARELG